MRTFDYIYLADQTLLDFVAKIHEYKRRQDFSCIFGWRGNDHIQKIDL